MLAKLSYPKCLPALYFLCLYAAVQSVDFLSIYGLVRADFHIIGLAFLEPGYGLGKALAADGSFDHILGKLLIGRADNLIAAGCSCLAALLRHIVGVDGGLFPSCLQLAASALCCLT